MATKFRGMPNKNPVPNQLSQQVQVKLRQALALHQRGYIGQAQAIFQEILRVQPKHFESLHLLSVIAYGTGQLELSVKLISDALKVNPNVAAAYSNFGLVLQKLKRLDEALANYDKALALKPDYAEAYNNRGVTLQDLKRLDEALASYDKALALKPDYADAYHNRGNALQELKRRDGYDKAVVYQRGEYWQMRMWLTKEKKYARFSLKTRNRNTAIDKANHELMARRLAGKTKRLEEALASYDKALALKPDYAEAYNKRGVTLQDLKRPDEALASYDKALALKPDYAEAYNNRGKALKELKRLDEALASYDMALALKSDYADAYNNRGHALVELKRLDEALASYDKAIALKPDFAAAYGAKSLGLLLNGVLEAGWKLFEWRWQDDKFTSTKRDFSQPLWLGNEPINDKNILLHSEQGLGDTIQFCRYAKLVAELGGRVVMEVPTSLLGLLNGLEGVAEFVEEGSTLPDFDLHCPLLSLPLAFKTSIDNIPGAHAYLRTNADKVSGWLSKLGTKTKPRVGLVWSGRAGHKNDSNRSIALSLLLNYLPATHDYVCLQKELREVDRATLQAQTMIRYFGEELADFTDTAALCELMDVVVSVDTSVAHLAGALGKKTWILLPYVPDWRWMLERTDSVWYQSVKLYRQDVAGDWGGVLTKVRDDLSKLVA